MTSDDAQRSAQHALCHQRLLMSGPAQGHDTLGGRFGLVSGNGNAMDFQDNKSSDGSVVTGEVAGRNRFQDLITENIADLIQRTGPGNQLPSERDISIKLAVSRNALRDRLRLMEALGILERRQGAGTFVKPMDPTGLAFALDLMLARSFLTTSNLHVVRVALERQGAIEAAHQQRPDTSAMRRALGVMAMSADRTEVAEADLIFHHRLLKLAGNPALSFFADALHGVLARSLTYRQERWQEAGPSRATLVQIHEAIVLAIESGDPEGAGRRTDEHFKVFSSLVEHQSTGSTKQDSYHTAPKDSDDTLWWSET